MVTLKITETQIRINEILDLFFLWCLPNAITEMQIEINEILDLFFLWFLPNTCVTFILLSNILTLTFERPWWRLFQKVVVSSKFDIFLFIIMNFANNSLICIILYALDIRRVWRYQRSNQNPCMFCPWFFLWNR
jgi:hypothetical protein